MAVEESQCGLMLSSPLHMPPYLPRTVPAGLWKKSGLLPRTAPDSEANLNPDKIAEWQTLNYQQAIGL